MKKITSLLCTLLFSLAVCSCGSNSGNSSGNSGGSTPTTHTHYWSLKSDTATCKQSGVKPIHAAVVKQKLKIHLKKTTTAAILHKIVNGVGNINTILLLQIHFHILLAIKKFLVIILNLQSQN